MHQNANAGLAPGAAVITGNEIATEDSAVPVNGQAVSLTDARARLIAVIRQKPEPQPGPTLFDVHVWRRASRQLQTGQILCRFSRRDTANIAAVIGVSTRCVNYWRQGAHAPTPRHQQQLLALHLLLHHPHP